MNQKYQMYQPPSPKTSHKKTYLAIGAALIVVLLCVCVVAGAFLWADPFQWGVVGSVKMLLGLGGNPAISAMPENTPVYIGFNLLNAQQSKLNHVIQPFVDAINTTTGNTGNAVQDLDKQMKKSMGVTITDDIVPWIGKNAGIGFTKSIRSTYSSPSDLGLVLALQSRNNSKADAHFFYLFNFT